MLFLAVGCGANEPPKNATKPIEVNEQQLGVVEKALKEAKIEGKILTVTPFNGEYHVMLVPESPAKDEKAGVSGGEGAMQPVAAPVSYIIGKDGKAKKGL